jgi:ankyrin repeat protein
MLVALALMAGMGAVGQTVPTPGPLLEVSAEEAQAHELKPHRSSIPVEWTPGPVSPKLRFVQPYQLDAQLTLTLTVSATGDVTAAEADGDARAMKFWPEVQGEVWQWKFRPFEKEGVAVAAKVEESVELVPPPRFAKVHVEAPKVGPKSKVEIRLRLERRGCMGDCPAYALTVSTEGVVFEGRSSVVAEGRHTAGVDADAVRELAKTMAAADFYSMLPSYWASVTDCAGYSLAVTIDGRTQSVADYMGTWVGMPVVVRELEEDVDALAGSGRWIKGSEGMVALLTAEGYNFKTFAAQTMLKSAARNGQAGTVGELLAAGVPLQPMAAPKSKEAYEGVPFEHVGWLQAGAANAAVVTAMIAAGAGKDDQEDKDLALNTAAEAGSLESVRALIAYGANPKVDLSKLTVTEEGGGMTLQGPGSGSVLIAAADSGNPAVVREILQYHPKLEARNRSGETAMFAAGQYRSSDKDGDRVECVKLLAAAGANVNARDDDGNTPLHWIFLTDVEEELVKLGADVNARNKDGETPLFTNVDRDSIPMLVERGADLFAVNKEGKTAADVAHERDRYREEDLRKAMAVAKR